MESSFLSIITPTFPHVNLTGYTTTWPFALFQEEFQRAKFVLYAREKLFLKENKERRKSGAASPAASSFSHAPLLSSSKKPTGPITSSTVTSSQLDDIKWEAFLGQVVDNTKVEQAASSPTNASMRKTVSAASATSAVSKAASALSFGNFSENLPSEFDKLDMSNQMFKFPRFFTKLENMPVARAVNSIIAEFAMPNKPIFVRGGFFERYPFYLKIEYWSLTNPLLRQLRRTMASKVSNTLIPRLLDLEYLRVHPYYESVRVDISETESCLEAEILQKKLMAMTGSNSDIQDFVGDSVIDEEKDRELGQVSVLLQRTIDHLEKNSAHFSNLLTSTEQIENEGANSREASKQTNQTTGTLKGGKGGKKGKGKGAGSNPANTPKSNIAGPGDEKNSISPKLGTLQTIKEECENDSGSFKNLDTQNSIDTNSAKGEDTTRHISAKKKQSQRKLAGSSSSLNADKKELDNKELDPEALLDLKQKRAEQRKRVFIENLPDYAFYHREAIVIGLVFSGDEVKNHGIYAQQTLDLRSHVEGFMDSVASTCDDCRVNLQMLRKDVMRKSVHLETRNFTVEKSSEKGQTDDTDVEMKKADDPFTPKNAHDEENSKIQPPPPFSELFLIRKPLPAKTAAKRTGSVSLGANVNMNANEGLARSSSLTEPTSKRQKVE